MKIYALQLYGNGILLDSAKDLSSVGYFNRNTTVELVDFMCTVLVQRITTNTSVTKDAYNIHVVVRGNRTVCVVTDAEYPSDVAFRLGQKILTNNCKLDELLKQAADPKEIDILHSIKTDLEDTKNIMRKNIEAVLGRGEKLDTLVAQSEELSLSSKAFYKGTKKMNSCCVIS